MGNPEQKKLFKYIKQKAALPLVLAALTALPARVYANEKTPSSINKMNSYSDTDKIQSSSNLQKGSFYTDSRTNETFQIRFDTIDFRGPKAPNNTINVKVIKHIWNDGIRLYHGLIYLEDTKRTYKENEDIIKLIFRKNIEAHISNFEVRIEPPVFLRKQLLGGQQPVQEALPIKIEPKISIKLRSSLCLLGGSLILCTGGIAFGWFFSNQRKDILALEKALGLLVKKGTFNYKALKLYETVFYPRCEKPIYFVELCKSLANLEVLNQLVIDQLKNLADSSRPGLLEILKGFQNEERKQLTELYKEFGF
jgi:hypothetical protein